MCVALAVFVRSPAAYEALKGFGLLQLSRATLQAYTGAFLDSPGTHAHTHMLVGSCLATKVFIGNLPAMGRDWVIIK